MIYAQDGVNKIFYRDKAGDLLEFEYDGIASELVVSAESGGRDIAVFLTENDEESLLLFLQSRKARRDGVGEKRFEQLVGALENVGVEDFVTNYDSGLYDTDETVTNDKGGKQSKLISNVGLVPQKVLLDVGVVLQEGADKYGEYNWLEIPIDDHIAHALTHIVRYNAQGVNADYQDLTHAICRIFFAAHLHGKQNDEF